MDTPKTITHLGLCAGYGGIELGLHRVLGNLLTVALCEIEGFAVANLVAKMEAGLMDCAPIWTDLKTFPWAEFRDRVDILTGGYPCQPFSAAGKRLGTEDPRHLWPFIASGIRILRPKLCFFENVEGHISLGLREVLGDLGAAGYTAAWGIFSASEVGAPHQRKRVFILAYDSSAGLQGREWCWQAGTQGQPSGHLAECGSPMAVSNSLGGAAGLSRSLAWNEGLAGVADNGGDEGGGELADSMCERRQQIARSSPSNEEADGGAGWNEQQQNGNHLAPSHVQGIAWPSQLADAGRIQPQGWGDFAEGQQSGAGGIPRCEFAPRHDQVWPSRPGEPQHAWEPPRVVANSYRLDWSAQAEGREHDRQAGQASAGQTQPAMGGDADGPAGGLGYAELCVACDNRTDELRLLGNGVVPATAERAFRTLMEELFQQQPTN